MRIKKLQKRNVTAALLVASLLLTYVTHHWVSFYAFPNRQVYFKKYNLTL
jgi:hypothetical protein